MEKDQLVKILNEIKERLFKARIETYEAIKEIEKLEKKVK